MSALMFHIAICVLLHNKIDEVYIRSLYVVIALVNCLIFGPERYFIYYDCFTVYLSMIGFDESDKFCWKQR